MQWAVIKGNDGVTIEVRVWEFKEAVLAFYENRETGKTTYTRCADMESALWLGMQLADNGEGLESNEDLQEEVHNNGYME